MSIYCSFSCIYQHQGWARASRWPAHLYMCGIATHHRNSGPPACGCLCRHCRLSQHGTHLLDKLGVLHRLVHGLGHHLLHKAGLGSCTRRRRAAAAGGAAAAAVGQRRRDSLAHEPADLAVHGLFCWAVAVGGSIVRVQVHPRRTCARGAGGDGTVRELRETRRYGTTGSCYRIQYAFSEPCFPAARRIRFEGKLLPLQASIGDVVEVWLHRRYYIRVRV